MTKLADLDFEYPLELVAVEPSRPTRVAAFHSGRAPEELTIARLLERFQPGDLLVINESAVIPARIFSADDDEILFLIQRTEREWEVLFPAREFKIGDKLALPGDITATLVQKGLPQILELHQTLPQEYFLEFGELALPPYIQDVRSERHNRPQDKAWYQPAWAKHLGSVAAPTASLHFSNEDLETLTAKGVNIGRVTLHVGAGTFLPIRSENLEDHVMHAERVSIPHTVVEQIELTKAQNRRVWALGTTVTRALESMALGLLEKGPSGFQGESRLFIRPGYDFKVVDVLMTNFHQPRSTLLCLVAAFAGLETVKKNYRWAIEREFKLFSYGDLSVWWN